MIFSRTTRAVLHPFQMTVMTDWHTNLTCSFLFSYQKADANGARKRRSRWGEAKTELPGLPTAISANGVSQAQLDNYVIHLRLEEISRKLRMNDFIPPERERYGSHLLHVWTRN